MSERAVRRGIVSDEARRASIVEAENRSAEALGNANAARTEAARERWLAKSQRWLDRANDLRGYT